MCIITYISNIYYQIYDIIILSKEGINLNNSKIVKLERYMSYLLRHHPEDLNLNMDNCGWVKLDELITKLNESKKYSENITKYTIFEVVKKSSKKRFDTEEYNKNIYIRANQGHSISVDLNLNSICPPDILYHGTADRFSKSIDENGILKMSRQYVHLSSDIETAKQVGMRHGNCLIYKVYAGKMYREGYKFYLSKNNVWLTDFVPNLYIEKI